MLESGVNFVIYMCPSSVRTNETPFFVISVVLASTVDFLKSVMKSGLLIFFCKIPVIILVFFPLSVPHRSGRPVIQWRWGDALHATRQVQGSPRFQGPLWLRSHQSRAGLERGAHGRIAWATHSPGHSESASFKRLLLRGLFGPWSSLTVGDC